MLSLSPFKMSFGPEKTAVFVDHVHMLLCNDGALICICGQRIVFTDRDVW